MVILHETGRIPVETHTGPNEFGMIEEARSFEHSGPVLRPAEVGLELKQLILFTILADVFVAPWGLASTQRLGAVLAAIVALLAKASAIGVVVAVIDDSFAKLRLFKITEYASRRSCSRCSAFHPLPRRRLSHEPRCLLRRGDVIAALMLLLEFGMLRQALVGTRYGCTPRSPR